MILIMRIRAVAGAVLLATVLASCGGDSSSASDGKTHVVAAFYPLAEAARQVGGADVSVDDLTPAGAEPHDIEITTRQVDKLEDADVVVVMGRDFQPAVEDIAKRRDGETIEVLEALALGKAHRDDPHVWLDPTLMQRIVGLVRDALVNADPAHAATYRANARRYDAQLASLDQEFETGLANCERDEIVTAHEAFGWLARRYGLQQHAIAGIAPDQEPSADRIAELSDLARNDGVTTIFTETLVSPRVADTLAREAGGLKTATLDPLEGVSEKDAKRGATYVSIMRANLRALQKALGCRVTP